MTAKSIYQKTMTFVWAKLMLGLATVVISAILFAILVGIGSLFGDGGTGITLLIWLGATGIVRFALMHYFGYMVKAGHIAIIATAVHTGKVPDNQMDVAKQMVTERFATSNIYFAVDKLVSGAVKQLQGVVDKAGNFLDAIPGMNAVTGIVKLFIDISLGYIDECCLGYTFIKTEQNAFKSAADGVVIYAQNWKTLLKSAAKTTVTVILTVVAVTLICFLVIGLLFKILGWSSFVAFVLAAMVAFGVKYAFIDSWILVKTMVTYMELAPKTVITFDLYSKLCGLSAKFKELFNKGTEGQPQPAYSAAGASASSSMSSSGAPKSVFCGQCGAKNTAGTKFCGDCGAAIM